MSCSTATSPIDIDISKWKSDYKCDLKCDYKFKYNNSSSIGTNRGDYISLSYDKSNTAPVTYNSSKYDVKEIRIYTPSLHKYNGKQEVAELIVIHTSQNGYNPLLVCVPIKNTNNITNQSNLLSNIIYSVSSYAPSDSEQTPVIDINLNTFIPNKPFYTYTGSQPYKPCDGKNDFIVFMPLNGGIDISNDVLASLKSVIRKHTYTTKSGVTFYLNEKGPGKNATEDDIYIDCQPVGSSDDMVEETVEVIEKLSHHSNINWRNVMQNTGFQIIFAILFSIFIIFAANMVLTLFTRMTGNTSNSSNLNFFGSGNKS